MDFTEGHLRGLIDGLRSLHDGDRVVGQLIGYGPAAIAALRDFLINGRPESTYQPRARAVEALAGLGAVDALIEFLNTPSRTLDPVVRFAEDAVENIAALELASWHTEEVFTCLYGRLCKRPQRGVIEAIGAFRRPETGRFLIGALEDDVCRLAAIDALRPIASGLHDELAAAATLRLPGSSDERPSSLLRRRAVLSLLAESPDEAGESSWALPLLEEDDPEVVLRAAQIILHANPGCVSSLIARRLVAVLPRADWTLYEDFERLLSSVHEAALPLLRDELQARSRQAPPGFSLDPVAIMKRRVERRVANPGTVPELRQTK